MTRLHLITLFLSLGLLVATSPGQAAPAANPPVRGGTQAAAAPPSTHDLKTLLDTLQNTQKRQALVAQIKTLIAVQERGGELRAEHGLGARILGALSSGFGWVAGAPRKLAENLGNPRKLWSSFTAHISNWVKHPQGLRTLGYAVLGLVAGLLARLLVGAAITRRRRQVTLEEAPWFERLRKASGRLAVDLLPILAFAAAAFGVAAIVPLTETARLALLAIVNATALSLAGTVLARFVLNPLAPPLRLVPLGDASAAYVYIWIRRLIVTVVWSYVILETGVLLGMSHALYTALAKVLGLFVTMLLVVFTLQSRGELAEPLKNGATAFAPLRVLPPPLRARLGEAWHILASVYLVALYIVWALAVPGGLAYLLRATVETAVVAALLLLAEGWVRRGLDRLFGLDAGLLARYRLVAQRANRYLPALRAALLYILRFGALLAVLAAWQVDVGSAVLSPVGRTILGHSTVILVIALLGLLTWEIASGTITTYLTRTDDSGQALVRSARVRTLLPLIRNVLLVTISVLTALVILSEVGVNIAPLLAGAGVVGLALGFGAQSLVKDVISGAFILFEGTINIGDVAVINGQGGLVEGLTIRSIRLRDLSGSVHTVNFGSVTSITNMTKDFSYYLFKVGVAYRENTDEVVALLREIDEEMRADPQFGPSIIEPIDILGVDEFADSAVIIRARTKTLPIKQWSVGREFNRRMKLKFDERGIEIPFPHQTIYFGEDKRGMAPPAHLAVRRDEPQPRATEEAAASDRPRDKTPPKKEGAAASASRS